MSRRAIQMLFVVVGLAWGGYVAVDLFSYTFGDCLEKSCDDYRDAMAGLIVWRGMFVALLIVLAYRFFRKDADV